MFLFLFTILFTKIVYITKDFDTLENVNGYYASMYDLYILVGFSPYTLIYMLYARQLFRGHIVYLCGGTRTQLNNMVPLGDLQCLTPLSLIALVTKRHACFSLHR